MISLRTRIDRLVVFIVWIGVEISTYLPSRQSLLLYLIQPLFAAMLVAGVVVSLGRRNAAGQLCLLDICLTGALVMLAKFHWYVLPFVYHFELKTDWLLEAYHHAFLYLLEIAVITFILRMHRRCASRRREGFQIQNQTRGQS